MRSIYRSTLCLLICLGISIGCALADELARVTGEQKKSNDAAIKKDGQYVHEPVWRYMLTHPVDKVGPATPLDPDCQKKGK